jgi:hypothetical protein
VSVLQRHPEGGLEVELNGDNSRRTPAAAWSS